MLRKGLIFGRDPWPEHFCAVQFKLPAARINSPSPALPRPLSSCCSLPSGPLTAAGRPLPDPCHPPETETLHNRPASFLLLQPPRSISIALYVLCNDPTTTSQFFFPGSRAEPVCQVIQEGHSFPGCSPFALTLLHGSLLPRATSGPVLDAMRCGRYDSSPDGRMCVRLLSRTRAAQPWLPCCSCNFPPELPVHGHV